MLQLALPKSQKLTTYVLWRVLPLAVLAMTVIGLMILSITEKTVWKTVDDRIRHQSAYVVERIAQRLNTILNEIDILAKNDLIMNGLIDAQSRDLYLPTFFASLRLGGVAAPRISLVDYKGKEIFHNNLPGRSGIDREEWNEALSRGEEIRYFGFDGATIAVPVLVHGLPEGAVVASFPASLTPMLFDTGAPDVDVDVVGDQGDVYFSSGMHEMLNGHDPDKWIEIWHKLPFFSGLSIVTAQPKAEAYRTLHQLRSFLVYAGLSALVALVGAIVFSTYLSSREMRKLSSILGGISRPEHFLQRVHVDGPSEVQTLGTTFNSMLETLQHTTTSKSYLNNILNSLREVLIVASPGGDVLTLNQEAERFLASRDLDKSSNVSAIVRSERYGVDQDPWDFLRLTGTTRYLESIYEFENAPDKALLWTKSVVLDEDGQESGRVYVATDITERLQMEQMKTEFVSTVSHELRTPLTSILGSIKLVQSGAAGAVPEKAVGFLDIAHKNSERLIRLINDILDIQKIEAGKMEVENTPLELCAHVTQSIKAITAYAEQLEIQIRFDVPDHEAWVAADPHRLDQVLANLVSNAVKFSDRGSEVRVEISRDPGSFTISVVDHGVGIPRPYQESVFEKFKQVDASDSRSKGGTGLGLAITKRLVEMMNGEIWFESEQGKGTTFHVRVPELTGHVALVE